jgi:hypothetical protein
MIDCWTCTEQYFSLYIQVEKRTSNKTLAIEYRSNKLKGNIQRPQSRDQAKMWKQKNKNLVNNYNKKTIRKGNNKHILKNRMGHYIFKASMCVNWGWLNPRCHVQKKYFIVIPERLVTRLNLFISIIPASSRTVKNLSPMTHPIPQNVFIIPLPDCLLVVIVHQVLIFFVFTFSLCLWIVVFGYSPLIWCFGILLSMFYCLSSFQLEYIS